MSHSTNLYRRLRELLPDAPLLIGDVTALGTTHDAQVTLPGGGVLQVRNPINATLEQRVFVQGHAITGLAPILPIEIIEI